jgi:hypothetical protein
MIETIIAWCGAVYVLAVALGSYLFLVNQDTPTLKRK